MHFINTICRKIVQFLRVRLDPCSLQFCLTLGIVIILVMEISIFSLWISWEVTQFVHPIAQQPNILLFFQRLGMMSLVAIAITTIVVSLFIRRSLLPLRQLNQWVTELDFHTLNFHSTPSEVKALAFTSKELSRQIQAFKQQQKQFTNDIAHELRTPLSIVYAYLQRSWQRNQNLTDNQQEALEMAVLAAERMTHILQNLLDLARASNSMMPLKSESLILNHVLTDVAQMTAKFEHRAINLEVTPFPVRVQADRNQIMQVFSHLISHAFKCSKAEDIVNLQLIQVKDWAVIQVSDQGHDILPSAQSQIFAGCDPVDPPSIRITEGLVQGLFIVKYLVESMGGQVIMQSQPGYGSTFILKLPTEEAAR
jgi:signal transduction histidine kinase